MKRIPVGIQTFRKIIEGDYVYVDKTQHIYNLVTGAKYYFLSRPRRFGKSLLLDTIGEVFRGERELFKGLWIYESDYDFVKHPVIRVDMSSLSTTNSAIFEYSLSEEIRTQANREGFRTLEGDSALLFKQLIGDLYNKYNQHVVVLIDEYDKPILDHIDDIDAAEENRKVLRSFYGILKSMDPMLRFTFFTGVSRFTKTSVFSELNNLTDISMVEKYADICGIPADSLEEHFGEHIANLHNYDAFKHYGDIAKEILAWYDGYTWDGKKRLLNPFSILSLFATNKIGAFWYSSGSTKILIDLIKMKPESLLSLKNLEMSDRALETFDINRMELEPLLFQTGYLTVKDVIYQIGPSVYRLDIPNLEVREALNLQVLAELTQSGITLADSSHRKIGDALRTGDLQKMLELLRGLFAAIPYELHVKVEAYYHSIFYAVMTLLGFDMDAEVSTSRGRIDAVLELEDKVYVMEFKYADCPIDASAEFKRQLFDDTLAKAIEQIDQMGYADRYQGSGKTIIKAALAFLGRDEIEMAFV